MKIEQRTVYVTDDGQEFDTAEKAIDHELTHDIVTYLDRDGGVYWRDTCASEVTQDLLEAFVVIRCKVAENMWLDLERAARFIEGFVGDEMQEGVQELLAGVEDAMNKLKA